MSQSIVSFAVQILALLNQLTMHTGKNIAILIGPEGGFLEEEVSICKSKDFRVAYLTPSILRTETAGLVAIAMILGQQLTLS